MRTAMLSIGLFALVAIQPGIKHRTISENRDIPFFVLLDNQWVCVDRNPLQVDRQDCWPRQSSKR
jgi:hypothetical protein